MIDKNEYILYVKTENGTPWKAIFEVLKDLLREGTIEFINDELNPEKLAKKLETEENNFSDSENDEEGETYNSNTNNEIDNVSGMKLFAVNTTQTVLVSLKLGKFLFSEFICNKYKTPVSINLAMFHKVIRGLSTTDNLTLSISNKHPSKLKIRIDNNDENKSKEVELTLLDIDQNNMSLPITKYKVAIVMKANEFNKVCKEMSAMHEQMEIRCELDRVTFTCEDKSIKQTTEYKTGIVGGNEIIKIIRPDNITEENKMEIILGLFELKNLVLFSKCQQLCEDIIIYMENKKPIIIRYAMSESAYMILALGPINNRTNADDNYYDSDDSENTDEDDDDNSSDTE